MMAFATEVEFDPVIFEETCGPALADIGRRGAENIAAAAEEILGVYGGGIPSDPGEPPRMQTGKGIQSIAVEGPFADGKSYVTIHGGEYLAMLDVGTRFIRPRPWIAQAIVKGTQRTV